MVTLIRCSLHRSYRFTNCVSMWFIVCCDAVYLQCFGDLDLGVGIEEGVRKLVADVNIVENKKKSGRRWN